MLNRASHVSGTVSCRRGVGRLAGLSIPLAPVQWSGFVAWGAIPSTRVHPCFPTLYPGQGGLGTPPWGTFPCSSLPCTTTAVGGSSVGWVLLVVCFLRLGGKWCVVSFQYVFSMVLRCALIVWAVCFLVVWAIVVVCPNVWRNFTYVSGRQPLLVFGREWLCP